MTRTIHPPVKRRLKLSSKPKAKRRHAAAPRVADEITAGMGELVKMMADSAVPMGRFRSRIYQLPETPKVYDAKAVKTLRSLLNASQALFARVLAVSTKLVQAWEQGARTPAPVVCRLFDEIEREPERWRVAALGR